ncbi:MAG: hypothetical protein PX640_23240, partial [Microcystis sp. M49629_WE12]|nr:hypothetical protein [Microcystis sp. M49629_WE12]
MAKNPRKDLFCLRLKKSENVKQEKEVWEPLTKIGLAPGLSLDLKGVKVTKNPHSAPSTVTLKILSKSSKRLPALNYRLICLPSRRTISPKNLIALIP